MHIDGKPVKNLTKKIDITITAVDCKTGQTKDPGGCAAAKAIVREVPGCTAARVHLSRTYLQVGDKWLRAHTPMALRSEIVAFDRGGSFEPGEYVINPLPPSERERIGKAHTLGGPKHGRPGHERKQHRTVNVRSSGANR